MTDNGIGLHANALSIMSSLLTRTEKKKSVGKGLKNDSSAIRKKWKRCPFHVVRALKTMLREKKNQISCETIDLVIIFHWQFSIGNFAYTLYTESSCIVKLNNTFTLKLEGAHTHPCCFKFILMCLFNFSTK